MKRNKIENNSKGHNLRRALCAVARPATSLELATKLMAGSTLGTKKYH